MDQGLSCYALRKYDPVPLPSPEISGQLQATYCEHHMHTMNSSIATHGMYEELVEELFGKPVEWPTQKEIQEAIAISRNNLGEEADRQMVPVAEEDLFNEAGKPLLLTATYQPRFQKKC
jgi:hypothetical protein